LQSVCESPSLQLLPNPHRILELNPLKLFFFGGEVIVRVEKTTRSVSTVAILGVHCQTSDALTTK